MSRGFAIVLCATLCACLPEPKFMGIRDADPEGAPDDGPHLDPVPNVTATQDGTGVLVSGGFFSMNFSNTALSGHYPTTFSVGGTSFFAPSQNEGCFGEKMTGMSAFPVMRANATADEPLTGGSVMASLTGNAVAQATVSWSLDNQCNGGELDITGLSLFTFFPDGRIHRFDRLITATATALVPNDCDCMNDPMFMGGFFFTSYVTLRDDQLSPTNTAEDPTGTIVDSTFMASRTSENHVCANGAAGPTLAFGFNTLSQLPRIRRVTPNTLTIVKDFLPGSFTNLPAPGRTDEMSTTMLASTSQPCPALMSRLTTIEAPTQIVASRSGGPDVVLTRGATDGMYQGLGAIGADEVVLRAAGGSSIPAGFAVRLTFSSARTFSVYRTGATDNGGAFQAVTPGNTSVVMWLREGLTAGQTVVVRATPI